MYDFTYKEKVKKLNINDAKAGEQYVFSEIHTLSIHLNAGLEGIVQHHILDL